MNVVFEKQITIEYFIGEEYQTYAKFKLKEYLASDSNSNGYSALDASNLEILIDENIYGGDTTTYDPDGVGSNGNTEFVTVTIPVIALSIFFLICFFALYYVYYKRKKRINLIFVPTATAGGLNDRDLITKNTVKIANVGNKTEGEIDEGNDIYSDEGNDVYSDEGNDKIQMVTPYI